MCITFFNIFPTENIQLLIAFNRDEQSKRETTAFGPLKEDPNIYAGVDSISGGTWLGANVKTGIMVFLTNYDLNVKRYGKSRGQLVKRFLKSSEFELQSPQNARKKIFDILKGVLQERKQYSAFNLCVYHIDSQALFYICSELDMKEPRILQKHKTHGLCNCEIDVIWPKTEYGIGLFEGVVKELPDLGSNSEIFDRLHTIMKNNKSFDPDPERESAIFVEPYFSEEEKADRKTKCTFYGVIRKSNQGSGRVLEMREVTYDQKQQETTVQYQKEISN